MPRVEALRFLKISRRAVSLLTDFLRSISEIFLKISLRVETAKNSVFRWMGRQDSNLRMTEPKSVGLPLADAPVTPVKVNPRTFKIKKITACMEHENLFVTPSRHTLER